LKRIVAIIRPFKLGDVRAALAGRIEGMTVEEVRGFGRQYGHSEIYRGSEYKVDFVPKVRLEILCEDREAPFLMDLISESARTGKIGDGKVFLLGVDSVVDLPATAAKEASAWGDAPTLKRAS
jgi:nitrogen regulatory protein PII